MDQGGKGNGAGQETTLIFKKAPRFGKSLFLSALRAYFEGKSEAGRDKRMIQKAEGKVCLCKYAVCGRI